MHWPHSRLRRIALISAANLESVTFESSWLQKGQRTAQSRFFECHF
jgi:hypothetical protein